MLYQIVLFFLYPGVFVIGRYKHLTTSLTSRVTGPKHLLAKM